LNVQAGTAFVDFEFVEEVSFLIQYFLIFWYTVIVWIDTHHLPTVVLLPNSCCTSKLCLLDALIIHVSVLRHTFQTIEFPN
jgi:hypothetical protein